MKIQLVLILFTAGVSCLFKGELWETGEVDLANGGDTIFYYLFRSRNKETRYKNLVIWLSGGPGCSSTTALFTENGPYMFNKTHKMFFNEYSWNEKYDLMFVDQPVGVGFSLSKDKDHFCRDEVCVAKNFHKFITLFYKDYHSEYTNTPLYITGESYAGHYIPAIAAYLLRTNDNNIPLKGIAIGNGLTDFNVQIPGYAKFLYENNLVGEFGYQIVQLMSVVSVIGLKLQFNAFATICFGVFNVLASIAEIKNVYDIRRNDTDNDLDYDIIDLMNQPEVQQLFNFKQPRKFTSVCNHSVQSYMLNDVPISTSNDLIYTMESGIKVLLYYGNKDYICNWRGGELLVDSLDWKGKGKYEKSAYEPFLYREIERGLFRQADNFTFLVVNDAGHMVPMDQKEVSLYMLHTFIEGRFKE